MTEAGKILDAADLYNKFGKEKADLIWGAASENFVSSASGKVEAFVKGASPERVYMKKEKPILTKKKNVILNER